MKTAVPPEEVVPKIWPIKQAPLTVAGPGAPIQITSLFVVMAEPAPSPKAILPLTVVTLRSALKPVTGGIGHERSIAGGRVDGAGGVAKQCAITRGRVSLAGRVGEESEGPIGRVGLAFGVV